MIATAEGGTLPALPAARFSATGLHQNVPKLLQPVLPIRQMKSHKGILKEVFCELRTIFYSRSSGVVSAEL